MTVPFLSHQTVSAEAWVRPQVSPFEIYGGQSGTGRRFPVALRFPIRWYCSHHKDKNDNPQTKNAPQLSESIGHKRESDIDFRASDILKSTYLTLTRVRCEMHTCIERNFCIDFFVLIARS